MFPHLVSSLFKGMKRDKEKGFKEKDGWKPKSENFINFSKQVEEQGKTNGKNGALAMWVCIAFI